MALQDIYEKIVQRYHELNHELSRPETAARPERFRDLSREQADLGAKVELYESWKKLSAEREDNRHLLATESAEEMRSMASQEITRLDTEINSLEFSLQKALIPKDPRDDRNVFMEIRAGTGGEESALFAADLFRMYSRYAEGRGWSVEITDFNQTGLDGYKEIVFQIRGRGVFSRLKFESGIHRVQRVPETESSGRVHTSAATVAVLPEADETEVTIRPEEIRVDVFRASGAGGQHVNKTESAVRITHLPTGLVVTCQDEKSQHKNRDRAMKVLRARLYEAAEEKKQSEISEERRTQVGSGDRSGKIRTYNFSQSRVTDHRINLSLYRLPAVLDGDLDELIDALAEDANNRALASTGF